MRTEAIVTEQQLWHHIPHLRKGAVSMLGFDTAYTLTLVLVEKMLQLSKSNCYIFICQLREVGR